MAAVTRLSIYNSARVRAGEKTVTVTTDTLDTPNRVLAAIYGDVVQEELETGAWAFATKRAALDMYAEDDTRALPFQYQIPSDAIVIDAVHWGDSPLQGAQFIIEDGSIWTAYDSDISVIYRYRADESVWPRRFAEIVTTKCTAGLMQATERHGEASNLLVYAQRKRIEARHSESRQRPDRPMYEGSIISRRRGGSGQRGFGLFGIPVSGGSGSSGSDATADDDLIVPAGSDPVSVPPGVGYVGVDCSTSDRTITYDASNTSLRRTVVIQKTSAGGVLTVNDGTTDIYPESTTQRVTYRRLSSGTIIETGRSA